MKTGVDFFFVFEKNNLPRGVAAAPAFKHGVRGGRRTEQKRRREKNGESHCKV